MKQKEVFDLLKSNPEDVFREISRILILLADNIIREPNNPRYKTINKSNIAINKKVISVKGGKEALILMGFEEKEGSYVLNSNTRVDKLAELKHELLSLKFMPDNAKSSEVPPKEVVQPPKEVVQPPKEVVQPPKEVVQPPKEVVQPPKEVGQQPEDVVEPPKEITKKIKYVSDRDSQGSGSSNELELREEVPTCLSNQDSSDPESFDELSPGIQVKRIVLPRYRYKYTNPLLRRIEHYFHNAQVYNEPSLLHRAKAVIPVELIEYRAVHRIRTMQQQLKNGAPENPNVMLQDFLIIELAHWFKKSFFTWVDSPPCEFCDGETKFSHMAKDISSYLYTDRIELHKCLSCGTLTPFPRYNDLYILLESRRGRCGEWANTFCLLCTAMGWDCRFVVEEGDHVWVEIYSQTQRRWLHCDPCEAVCDRPLMYEIGWRKKISYVIAYSPFEVQDVTWRYTCNFDEALARRNECTEPELIDCLMNLRKERQKTLSQPKRQYMTRRLLEELFSFFKALEPGEADEIERMSGSLDWRMSRGEAQDQSHGHFWMLNDTNVINYEVRLQYQTSDDKYFMRLRNGGYLVKKGWSSGVFTQKNIFRKEELDWKTVYLARRELCDVGKVCWKFYLSESYKSITEVMLYLEYKTFENGKVDIKIEPGEIDTRDKFKHMVKLPENCREVTVTVTLSEGKGDVAWQHAQLFRQPLSSDGYPFQIVLKVTK